MKEVARGVLDDSGDSSGPQPFPLILSGKKERALVQIGGGGGHSICSDSLGVVPEELSLV